VGHIQSAYCEGQKEVVTAAHNRCNRFLQREVQRLVEEVEVLKEEHEESMKGLWEREELREVCLWSELAEVAWQQREEGPLRSRCVGKGDRDGELRQAVTPRKDVRQDLAEHVSCFPHAAAAPPFSRRHAAPSLALRRTHFARI